MEPGSTVAGRFEIEAEAGSGGMGTVYRAVDRANGAAVALKLLRGGGTATDMERFQREAATLADLRHPGIVRYIAHGATPGGEHYLVMEWLEGETLADLLKHRGLDFGESVILVRAVAEALAIAHARGVVHRDIKPQNLWLVGGGVDRVKLLDFGIARPLEPERWLTQTGTVLGTPGYMAPEQVRGAKGIDARTDVFALGCLLFRCLTGHVPFASDSVVAVLARTILDDAPRVSETRPDVPPALDELVARMLAKEPGDRPEDARAVASALAELGELTLQGGPPVVTSAGESITGSEQRLLSVVLAGPLESLPTAEREASLREAVASHGGKLEWLADGTYLVPLGTAGAATDLAARAARCALAIRARVPDAPLIISTGRGVVAGRMPVGEVVERAARSLERALPGRILIDDVSANLLDERFQLAREEAGIFLEGELDAVAEARTLLGKPTRFVGRDRELGVLEGVYREAVGEPVARVVLVTAPAGTGKTRLRQEFLRRLHQLGGEAEVLIGRGDPSRAGSPFSMLADAVRRLVGIQEGEPIGAQAAKLVPRIARYAPFGSAPRLCLFLGAMAGFSTDEIAAMDPLAKGDAMRAAWIDWLSAECAVHPVLLVLEDLHWGDRPTIDFVDQALRALHDKPFMVVALARPEVTAQFPGLWESRELQELRLGPLTPKAGDRLVREALGALADDATIKRVLDHAQGNAFFLEELIRAVAEGRGDTLPETVLGMVQARLDALGSEAKRILRAASVFGGTFWREGVATLMGEELSGPRLDEWLGELVQRELLVRRESSLPGQAAFAFSHDLVRETAYAMLTDHDRLVGHRLAGRWLEAQGAGDALALGEHYARGGEPQRAAAWFRRAAEKALEGNDFEGSIARAQRGLALGPPSGEKAALYIVEAEAHMWRGEHTEIERCASAAAAEVPRGSALWFRASDERFFSFVRRADLPRAGMLLQEIGATEPAGPDAVSEKIACLARAAIALIRFGLVDMAEGLIHQTAALAGGIDQLEPRSATRVHSVRGLLARRVGDVAGYFAAYELAEKACAAIGDVRTSFYNKLSIGSAYLEIGMIERAEPMLRANLEDAERLGVNVIVPLLQYVYSLTLHLLGREDEAFAMAEKSIAGSGTTGDAPVHGMAMTVLAELTEVAGRHAEAEERAEDALAHLPPGGTVRANAMIVRARARSGLGRHAEAVADARQAMAMVDQVLGFAFGESFVTGGLVEVLVAAGQREEAKQVLDLGKARVTARAAALGGEYGRAFVGSMPDNVKLLARSL